MKISIKGQVQVFSSLSLNNTDVPTCTLKELLVAGTGPPVHTGPEQISSSCDFNGSGGGQNPQSWFCGKTHCKVQLRIIWGFSSLTYTNQVGIFQSVFSLKLLFEFCPKKLHLPKSVNNSQDICGESSNANVRIQANSVAADGPHSSVCYLSVTVKSAQRSGHLVLVWSNIL